MEEKSFFETEEKEHGIYMIHAPLGVKCYVVTGADRAMVIDTGNGIGSLKKAVEMITDLPVFVVNTHGHPDHAGGNIEFAETYMHPADDSVCREMCTKEYRKSDIEAILGEDAGPYTEALLEYKPDYLPMKDGDCFELGGRKLQVIFTPGHTRGSCCLLDKSTGILFSGDTVSYAETWMYLDYSTELSEYAQSLCRLKEMESRISGIYPAHTPEEIAPIPAGQISELYACVQAVLDGTLTGDRIHTFAGSGMLARRGNGAIIYREMRNRPGEEQEN